MAPKSKSGDKGKGKDGEKGKGKDAAAEKGAAKTKGAQSINVRHILCMVAWQ